MAQSYDEAELTKIARVNAFLASEGTGKWISRITEVDLPVKPHFADVVEKTFFVTIPVQPEHATTSFRRSHPTAPKIYNNVLSEWDNGARWIVRFA